MSVPRLSIPVNSADHSSGWAAESSWPSGRSSEGCSQIAWRLIENGQSSPTPRSGAAGVVLDNSLYVFGGYGGSNRLSDMHRFDILNSKWSVVTTSGQTPTARETTGAVVRRNALYMFGGYSGSSWLNDLWRFDNDANNSDQGTWVEITCGVNHLPAPRFGFSSGIVDDKLIIFGGFDGTKWMADTWLFDFDKVSWSLLSKPENTPNPSARSCPASSVVDDALYIFGGFDGTNRLNDLWCFSRGTWKFVNFIGLPPTPRYLHTAGVISDSLFVFGGFSGSARLGDVHRFNINKRVWGWPNEDQPIESTKSPTGRSSLVGATWKNKLFIYGGFDGSAVSDQLWELTVAPIAVPRRKLHSDLFRMLNEYADAEFTVEGKSIRVNKAFLAARSPHFHALFFGGMRESTQTSEKSVTVPLPGVELAPFEAVLEYLVSDELTEELNEPETVMKVLELAQRFLLERLTALCTEIIISRLSVENSIPVLLAAHSLDAIELKTACLEYVVRHESRIKSESPALFKDLLREPEIMLDILMRRKEF